MPKGAGWKTPMVPRVLTMPVVSRVLMMSEGTPEGVVGGDRYSVVRAEDRVLTRAYVPQRGTVALEPRRYDDDRREGGAAD